MPGSRREPARVVDAESLREAASQARRSPPPTVLWWNRYWRQNSKRLFDGGFRRIPQGLLSRTASDAKGINPPPALTKLAEGSIRNLPRLRTHEGDGVTWGCGRC